MDLTNFLPWMHAHIFELQAGGLVATCVVLLLALALLNRAVSELNRSREQRLSTEPVFERIHMALSAARERGDSELSEARSLTPQAANETELPREAVN